MRNLIGAVLLIASLGPCTAQSFAEQWDTRIMGKQDIDFSRAIDPERPTSIKCRPAAATDVSSYCLDIRRKTHVSVAARKALAMMMNQRKTRIYDRCFTRMMAKPICPRTAGSTVVPWTPTKKERSAPPDPTKGEIDTRIELEQAYPTPTVDPDKPVGTPTDRPTVDPSTQWPWKGE